MRLPPRLRAPRGAWWHLTSQDWAELREDGVLIAMGAVFAVVLAVALAGCSNPAGPSSGDPREAWVISETARIAGQLHVQVRGLVTDEVLIGPCSDGTQCPAAGWYEDGVAHYWRPVVLERSLDALSWLAAEETCHAIYTDHGPALRACMEKVR